jgi:hypothetical protein
MTGNTTMSVVVPIGPQNSYSTADTVPLTSSFFWLTFEVAPSIYTEALRSLESVIVALKLR